jgi:hypothetical protein
MKFELGAELKRASKGSATVSSYKDPAGVGSRCAEPLDFPRTGAAVFRILSEDEGVGFGFA